MLTPTKINFQKLQMVDLPLMYQWLNTDFVMQWYGREPITLEQVNKEYGDYIEGRDVPQPYLIRYDTLPIGYIQTYKISDDPDWAKALEPTEEAAGIDLFIGHADYIHRGLGSFVLKRFMQEIIFSQPEIESCLIDPDTENKVAIRAYEKAGFVYWKTIPEEDGPPEAENHVMRITKSEFLASLLENTN